MTQPKPLSSYNLDELHARLVQLGEDWADRDGAASMLEETLKSLLAKLMKDVDGKSMAEREMLAKAMPAYESHVLAMVTARREALRCRVRYDSAKVWCEMARSLEASRRAEVTLR